MNLIRLLTVVLVFSFWSCREEKPAETGIIKIYNDEDFATKLRIIDTLCENDIKRAESDIQEGRLSIDVSYLYKRWNWDFTSGEKKYPGFDIKESITPLLEKFNVRLDTTFIYGLSIRAPYQDYFSEYCYQRRMKEELDNRYGSNFIDSVAKIAERDYLINNPDIILDPLERDKLAKNEQGITFDDFITKCEMDFELAFVYPKGYQDKSEKPYSYTSAEFILMKNGEIKNLTVESSFANPANEKYRAYFEKEVREFVQKTKWVHPVYSGLVANSTVTFTFYHK